jgi:peptidoglycan-N-acetylglucosamine deacetylase
MRVLVVLIFLSAGTTAQPARIVSSGSGLVRSVAFTFDAGADRGYAAAILTTLERSHIHATFGMTGKWAQANGDLVRRMARDGDSFINHTYDHRSFTGLSTRTGPLTGKQRRWEIEQTERIVHRLTGRSTKPYFRPPYGDYDGATLTLSRALGYRYMVMWTVDSLGWEGIPASEIVRRCEALVKPGTILLMHVGVQSQDAQALRTVVLYLKRHGYRFERIGQLVAEG